MTRYDVDISNFSFLDISLALCVGITIHDVLQKAIRMLYCQRNQTTEAIGISQIRVDDDMMSKMMTMVEFLNTVIHTFGKPLLWLSF